jgi:hypothetical protein
MGGRYLLPFSAERRVQSGIAPVAAASIVAKLAG